MSFRGTVVLALVSIATESSIRPARCRLRVVDVSAPHSKWFTIPLAAPHQLRHLLRANRQIANFSTAPQAVTVAIG